MTVTAFSEPVRNYFAARAISPELAMTVGVLERGGHLLFPYTTEGGAVYHRERTLNGHGPAKVKQPAGQPLALWWPFGTPKGDGVLVAEGESDLLAAAEPLSDCSYADLSVTAIPGTGFPTRRLAEQLAEVGVRRAFLAFDGDDAGRSYTEQAIKALEEVGITALPLELPDGTDLAENLARASDRARWLHNALLGAEALHSLREPDGEGSRGDAEGTSVAYVASVADWPEPPLEQAFTAPPVGSSGRSSPTPRPTRSLC